MASGPIAVTGATSAIGESISRYLAAAGMRLILIGRDRSKLENVRSALPNQEQHELFEADFGDVAKLEDYSKSLSSLASEFAGFIHVAGVWHIADKLLYGKKFHEIDPEEFSYVDSVTLQSAISISRHIIPKMTTDGSARIVFITGTFASGATNWTHYYCSKQSLEVLCKALSDEYGSIIPCNCVSPADVDTPPLRAFFPEDAASGLQPADVAAVVEDIFSDKCRHLTGQTIILRRRL